MEEHIHPRNPDLWWIDRCRVIDVDEFLERDWRYIGMSSNGDYTILQSRETHEYAALKN